MPWKEKLYERRLKRPFDDQTRRDISSVFHRRRGEVPLPMELFWHPSQPCFTIKSTWLSFIAHFTPEKLVVDAELSLAARMLATDEHRRNAVKFLDEIVTELNL